MKRFVLPAIFVASVSLVRAQSPTTGQFTVATNPPIGRFTVDGQPYVGSATFLWPVGSKHTLELIPDTVPPTPTPSSPGTLLTSPGGWVDNAGLLTANTDLVQVVTADPRITSFTITLTPLYRVILPFFTPSDNEPPTCGGSPGTIDPTIFRPGLVYINNTCYWSSSVFYLPAGTVKLNAFPYPGFVFLGWATNATNATQYLTQFTLNSPVTISPLFSPAKRVTFLTDPPGLQVLIDHTVTPTRGGSNSCVFQSLPPGAPATITPLCYGDFDFAPNSTHTIAGVSPQIDSSGNAWAFDSWSNGAGQNSIYTADANTAIPVTLTAKFVPGIPATVTTNPSGLKVEVDGRQNWPNYNFVWGVGSTHTIAPVMQQKDRNGRAYVFQSWSNNGPTTQTLNLDQSYVKTGVRITANYARLSRVQIQTVPAGLTIKVDGSTCQTPCNIDRANGSQISLSAPTSIATGSATRLDFASWSDGGAASHSYTVSSDFATLTLNYVPSYRLTATSSPAGAAQFSTVPPSADSFFPANSSVSVTANPNPGFKFVHWAGDLSGTYPSGTLVMNAPHTVAANFQTVPYIAPAGVQNAAGQTPVPAVAPGSLIAISGQSLAAISQTALTSLLPQTLAGVSVTVLDHILPLVSVAPDRIVAQLPSNLSDGNYTLVVHSVGQDDTSADFTVQRNAPGLFSTVVNSQPFASALHQDGSAITLDSPARHGEQISILGTGFGPTNPPTIDGFAVPSPAPPLADALDLIIGGELVTPDWSGAVAGSTGYEAVKVHISDGMPSASSLEVTVRVNGQSSNTVLLPIE